RVTCSFVNNFLVDINIHEVRTLRLNGFWRISRMSAHNAREVTRESDLKVDMDWKREFHLEAYGAFQEVSVFTERLSQTLGEILVDIKLLADHSRLFGCVLTVIRGSAHSIVLTF